MLPTPHFIVFYNGSDEMPDEKIKSSLNSNAMLEYLI